MTSILFIWTVLLMTINQERQNIKGMYTYELYLLVFVFMQHQELVSLAKEVSE